MVAPQTKARGFQATAAIRRPTLALPKAVSANSATTGLNAARKATGAPTVAIIKRNHV